MLSFHNSDTVVIPKRNKLREFVESSAFTAFVTAVIIINAVTLGTMQGDPEIHPDRHIFVASKAPWVKIADGLPEHEDYPPASTD